VKNKNRFRILAAAVLCLLLPVGCAYNPETVMTIGDTEITAGVYLFTQFTTAQEAYGEYGAEAEADSVETFIDTENDYEIEGVPVRDWINDKLVEKLKEYAFVEQEFDRLNLYFSGADLSSLEYMREYYWQQWKSTMERNGIGAESFDLVLTNDYKRDSILKTLYGEGGEMAFSDEEYEAYFLENYTRVDYLKISLVDPASSAPLEAERQEEISELAGVMLEAANAPGSGLEAAYIAHYGEIAALLGDTEEKTAETFTRDAVLNSITTSTATSPDEELVKAFFEDAEDAGDAGYKLFTKEDDSITLYRVVGLQEDDTYKDYVETMRSVMAEEPFKEYVSSKTALMEADIDKRAVKHYSLDKSRFS
jgi:hypothetical protein